jgi:cytoskeletal protein RodZ
MKTAGEILAAARIKKGWNVEELSRKTKIQAKFLTAIESSQFEELPPAPFVKGFVKTIAAELGLNPGEATAVFRRDFKESAEFGIIPRTLETGKKIFEWNPKLTAAAATIIIIISFLGYLGWQLAALISRPKLIIFQPKDKTVVSQEVAVEGQTEQGITVTINGQEIKINQDGSFSQILSLTLGEHTITVAAEGQNGKKTTTQRTVRVR